MSQPFFHLLFVLSKICFNFPSSSLCCWLLFPVYGLSDSLITQSGLCSVCVCVCVCVCACAPDSHGMGTFNHFKIGSRTASDALARHVTCNSGTSLVRPTEQHTSIMRLEIPAAVILTIIIIIIYCN